MEIDWLEDFLALSAAGVFARAADARNISQSAFTRRIKNLENWTGTPLFDRSVHPVELTAAGKAFKQTAIDTVAALKQTKSDIRGLSRREASVLDFVALHTLAISFFPTWLTGMSSHLGPIKSRLVAENFSGCAEAILSGNADFMLCYYHPAVPTISDENRYPSSTIAKDQIIAVSCVGADGRVKYSLAADNPVPFLSYPPDTFLGRVSQVCLERGNLGDAVEPVYENSVAEALKSACLAGLGVAFLPEGAAERELQDGTLHKISRPEYELAIEIKLYRSIERSRAELERFWMLAQNL
ncbi:LysR family transcriptional regulator [Phaeobacter italicus]|uniref:LysR family transcriptional regulator n=1 Tax=Phaeobacter italicus TaxID=481446 RepID=UPI001C95A61B|nr:LysR family transcriptional regulator [Phaeobacter italicus]MBY5978312.1 LysR family transcriptional regulator [Phaeobacter italicus]MEC8015486.1 LysR family transcriptional regulator [Pseudomonadota bacterium]